MLGYGLPLLRSNCQADPKDVVHVTFYQTREGYSDSVLTPCYGFFLLQYRMTGLGVIVSQLKLLQSLVMVLS